MDLGRDEDQENIIEDIICDGDDLVTSLFLNNSGEGDGQTEGMVPMREKAPMRKKAPAPMREKSLALMEP
jgi:hypothetical protein